MNKNLEKLIALDKSAYSTDVSPFFTNCKNAIVFESSGIYAPYLDVALRSLIYNADDDKCYDIIILTKEIDLFDCNLISAQIKPYKNISIRFYDPTRIVEKYIKKAKYYYLNLNYFKLAIPWILDKYEKVLNLGMDVVIKKDVSKLFDIQMDETEYIAGAIDLGYIGRLSMDIPKEELDLKNPEGYINADVLVFNNMLIRKDFSMDNVMELWQKYKFRCAEQDALNILYENHIHYLDLNWNVMPRKMASMVHIAHNTDNNIKLWKECLKNPYIVHFAAYPKSWDYPDVEFANEWWCYARQSPYYEELIRRMILANKGFIISSKTPLDKKIYNKLLRMFSDKSKLLRLLKRVYIKLFKNKEENFKFGKLGN